MKLDEYKKIIETKKQESLKKAIADLTKANNVLVSNFNLKETEQLDILEKILKDYE